MYYLGTRLQEGVFVQRRERAFVLLLSQAHNRVTR